MNDPQAERAHACLETAPRSRSRRPAPSPQDRTAPTSMMGLMACSVSGLGGDRMPAIPSVDLGMAGVFGIASANITLAAPIHSQLI